MRKWKKGDVVKSPWAGVEDAAIMAIRTIVEDGGENRIAILPWGDWLYLEDLQEPDEEETS